MSESQARLARRTKQLAGALLVIGVAYFFWRAIRRNWAQIQAHQFHLSYPLVALSFSTAVASGLLATYAWTVILNGLSGNREMTFARSVATVNSTSLTKYLPGKFWSYALQMYWLARSGYSKGLVLYVNLTNLVVSLLMGMLLALGFLVASGRFPLAVVGSAFLVLLIADVLYVLYNGVAFRLLSTLVRKLLKREIGVFEMPTGLLLRVHVIHLLGQLVSGVGGYVLCFAIGYRMGSADILLVMAALILADNAGFIFFLVPGGLGIREATMYFLLRGAAASTLALVFPLVSRIVYMVSDVLLGLVALSLLKKSVKPAQVS
jgi:uncharacterized membrane protein YbhN (UPF0104 family)